MEPKKNIYFIGSGISLLAGIPTFSNFVDRARSIYFDKDFARSDDYKMFENVLTDRDEYYRDYNIEEYYAIVDLIQILSSKDCFKSRHRVDTKDIENVMYTTVYESSINMKKAENHYLSFLNHIKNTDSAIISTNWDIVLESYIWNYWIDYGSIDIRIHELDEDYNSKCDEEHTFTILKPHGSLNWGICNKCKLIYYYSRLPLDRVESDKRRCFRCNEKLNRAIIPPTPFKLSRNINQIKQIWNEIYYYINHCETIYFIGYSFPYTDLQIKYWVTDALRTNYHLKNINIITNDKSKEEKKEFERHYKSIIPQKASKFTEILTVEFCYEGFDNFLRHIEGKCENKNIFYIDKEGNSSKIPENRK